MEDPEADGRIILTQTFSSVYECGFVWLSLGSCGELVAILMPVFFNAVSIFFNNVLPPMHNSMYSLPLKYVFLVCSH